MSTSDSADPPLADRAAGLDWRLGGQSGIRIGPTNTIADVPGIRVGHASRVGDGWLTGVTVVVAEGGAVAAADVRGGGAATRETAALEPTGVVDRIDAVALSGGSAYGLESASGVLSALQERGLGFRVGRSRHEVVPVVPGASVFDLGRGGSFRNHPGPPLGRLAAETAFGQRHGSAAEQGSIGAGTGAITGDMRGGVGSASAVLPGGVTVAALVVVNADGTTLDPRSGAPWGLFAELRRADGRGEFGIRPPTAREHARALDRLTAESAGRPALRPLNTTLVVVATDADLDKARLGRLAGTGHDGMTRAIRPVHTLGDGDVVFALATGRRGLPPAAAGVLPEHRHADAVNQVLSAGADVVTRAIVHAVLAATTITTPAGTVPSYRDLYAS
ncbi:P1 family peptidase [uncultured Amnibacterium sp.]|uniref:P1 family peptidase n=1 Tax=uncultured Amnibacterium sp. TaxID=1631851 RepID=UPI0035CA5F00